MPLNFLATVYVEGRQAIPYYDYLKIWVPAIAAVSAMKYYFAGPRISWERNLHGRVFLVTGGTSGLGAQTIKELAGRGAQVVLLVRDLKDGWLVEYIDDLRDSTGNPCIYAEECDLADLYSVRKFATKWIDNMLARRVDGVICCAAVQLPPGMPRQTTPDGLEPQFQVNYLSHYLLLTVMAPALRAQPPDREVRVVLTSCISAVMAELKLDDLGYVSRPYPQNRPHVVAGEAKLELALLGMEMQRQFDAYERKDNAPPNVHVVVVDPGIMRSPSFKRFITMGRVWLLGVYLLLWPLWWLFLKSNVDGVQSILFAIMSPEIVENKAMSYVSDARIRSVPPRSEFKDAEKQKQLFDRTASLLETVEKRTATERNRMKPTKKQEPKKQEPANAEKPKKTEKKATEKKSTKKKH